MPPISITVTYNANSTPSISVSNNNPSVPRGTSVITWTPSGCTFSTNTGIVFAATTNTPAVWSQSQPSYNQGTGNYTVTDVNNGGATTKYNYNVSVKTLGGTRKTRYDPDITNTP
jgi:hypothetical protein